MTPQPFLSNTVLAEEAPTEAALLRFQQFSPEPVAMGFMLHLHLFKRRQNATGLGSSRSPRRGSISSVALPARAGLWFPIEIRPDKPKQTVNWLQIGFSDAVSTAAHFLEKPRPVCLRRGFFVVANRHLAGLPH
jgi:hypothetical protein